MGNPGAGGAQSWGSLIHHSHSGDYCYYLVTFFDISMLFRLDSCFDQTLQYSNYGRFLMKFLSNMVGYNQSLQQSRKENKKKKERIDGKDSGVGVV